MNMKQLADIPQIKKNQDFIIFKFPAQFALIFWK